MILWFNVSDVQFSNMVNIWIVGISFSGSNFRAQEHPLVQGQPRKRCLSPQKEGDMHDI